MRTSPSTRVNPGYNLLPTTTMPWFNYEDEHQTNRPSDTIPNRRRVDRFKLQVKSRRTALILSYAPDWCVSKTHWQVVTEDFN